MNEKETRMYLQGESRRRWLAGIVFVLLLTAILAYKANDLGWFAARPPLALNGRPAILFFNNDRGCECAMVVYRNADSQMSTWPEEARGGLTIFPINLERRPDLGKQVGIVRAPALVLLDHDGKVVFLQKEALSDTTPLDLKSFEKAIEELLHGD